MTGPKPIQHSNSNVSIHSVHSTPGGSPRFDSNKEPISMTAFDLIGIVSTQMLNNVFTRGLQSSVTPRSYYTRFTVSKKQPIKILWVCQETLNRMTDCTYKINNENYEIYIEATVRGTQVKLCLQLFETPTVVNSDNNNSNNSNNNNNNNNANNNNEYVVEFRRLHGNIFRYHEFYEEFHSTISGMEIIVWENYLRNNLKL